MSLTKDTTEELHSFGQRLKKQRKALDLTQEALAGLAGCSLSSIRKIEAGILRPSKQVAELLARQLQITPDERDDFIRLARSSPITVAEGPGITSQHQDAYGAIPVPPTELVGRERETSIVRDMLDIARMVTLTGPPGTGKTRLAIQVAGEIGGGFRDGVCFVALASVSDTELLEPAIAAVLGIHEASGVALQDTLIAFLHNKNLLMLLDNFEQIISAAPQVAQLLAAAPDLKVLATSREELRLRGERVFNVPPLALPGENPALSIPALGTIESVALFLRRAQDTTARFELNADNAPSIAAICRRLEGLPLALELAAAWVPVLSPQRLLEMLDRRLPMLSHGARDLPPHQQTLRDAIARSYDLLTTAEQHLFRCLAVFAGGSTVEAVAAVASQDAGAGEPEILIRLNALRSKSLLRVEVAANEMRFIMLEMIREYATEQLLASGEEASMRRAHALYYLDLAEQMERSSTGPKGRAWLARIEREYANIRTALQWLLQMGWFEQAARMASALGVFWRYNAHWTEGMGWLNSILARGDDLTGEIKAKLLRHAGVLSMFQGEYIRADEFLGRAEVLSRQLDARTILAETLEARGMLGVLRDEYERAEVSLQECLALYREAGDEHGIAIALNGLGHQAYAVGDPERAERLLAEALSLFENQGDLWGMFRARQNLGSVLLKLGDYKRARALNLENLQQHRSINSRSGIASTAGQLAMLSLAEGDYDEAQKLGRESYQTFLSLGATTQAAIMLLVTGMSAAFKGDYREAEAICLESLTMLRRQGAPYDIAGNLIVLAATAAEHSRPERAACLLGATEAMVQAMGADIWPSSRRLLDLTREAVLARLGNDDFESAYTRGAALNIQSACDYALEAQHAF